jgi:hypothetical protein
VKVGDTVYNEWHGIRRYGVIASLSVRDEGLFVPWTYARVKWFDDEAYEGVVESTNALRNNGTDACLREYRTDQIRGINLEKEIVTLQKMKKYLHAEGYTK